MPKNVAALALAAVLMAVAPAAFADEPNTMLGNGSDSGLDSGANVEVPSVMQNGAEGDALLGGAEATVVPVSAGDGGATTMDEKVSLPSALGSSARTDAWSVGSESAQSQQTGYDLRASTANADASPFYVSSGSPGAASFGNWSLSSSGF